MRLLNLLAIGLIILMFISAILPVFENVKSFKSACYILKADQAVRSFVSHTIPTTIKIPTKIPGTIKKIDLTRCIIIANRTIDIAAHIQKQAKPNTIYVTKQSIKPAELYRYFYPADKIIDGCEIYQSNV